MRKHERRANRLDALLCNILSISIIAIFLLSCIGTFVTRLHMFQEALNKRRKQFEDNLWLEEQCKQPDFYHNMKHHSTICEDIALARSDSLWLHALRDVVDKSSVCGSQTCEERLTTFLAWVFGPGLMSTVVFISSIFFLIYLYNSFYKYLRSSPLNSNASIIMLDDFNIVAQDVCPEVQCLKDHRTGHRQMLLKA